MVWDWFRSAISPLPGVLVKHHNLTVLTRMQHPHGLVTVDFNVSLGLVGHNHVRHLTLQYCHPQLQDIHMSHNVNIEICV